MNDVLKYGLLAGVGYVAWQYFFPATPAVATPSPTTSTPAAQAPAPAASSNALLSVLQATNPAAVLALAQKGGTDGTQIALPASGLFNGYQWNFYTSMATGLANLPGVPNVDQPMSFQAYWSALLVAAAAPGAGLSGFGNYIWGGV